MNKTIYYITGAGRSGSTLFDICLGNLEHTFSLGELIFFVQNGIIDKEYCSCGKIVTECDFWKSIIKKWDSKRELSFEEFNNTQGELTRNKHTLQNIYRYFFPTSSQKKYYTDLNLLYAILFETTNEPILIDSSKNSHFILILKKLNFEIKILHITRKFSGVLNSAKKYIKKNPSEGVETELIPMRFSYVLSIWFIDNILPFFYSLGLKYKRIKYENIISNPKKTLGVIQKLSVKEEKLLNARGPLLARHLVAGNKMRMAEKIFIEEPKQMKWESNVKTYQKTIARLIDFFY